MHTLLILILFTITLSIVYIGCVLVWFIRYSGDKMWMLRWTQKAFPPPIVERIYKPIDLQAWFKLPPYPEDEMSEYIEYATKRSASDLGLEALKHGCIEIEYPDEYKYDCIRRNRSLPLSMYDNEFPIVRMRMRVYKEQ